MIRAAHKDTQGSRRATLCGGSFRDAEWPWPLELSWSSLCGEGERRGCPRWESCRGTGCKRRHT